MPMLRPRPFTDRLVAKFELPVDGWRGGQNRRRVLDDVLDDPGIAVPASPESPAE